MGVDLRVLSPRSNTLPGHFSRGSFSTKFGKSVGFSLYISVLLRRWSASQGIQLLHVNGGPGGVLLTHKPEVPVVYTAHHTYAQQARLVQGQAWKRVIAPLEGRGYALSDAVCADSASTRDSVVSELGVSPSKVRVIASGIDPEVFRPTEAARLDDSALFVGRLDERKGFRFLLESWPDVLRQRKSARLYVIGAGPLRRWADEFIARQRVDGSVVFLGRQTEEQLVTWYNRVSVVVVPSVFEGFGLVALEALACGTPVVATDVEGLRDVVKDRCDGTRVPYGDPRVLANALAEHLAAPRRVDDERLERLRAEHDWHAVATSYREVFAEVEQS